MSKTKRVAAMALALLAFIIFVGSPFGMQAHAVVGVDDAIILVLIAALAACGISLVVTGEYSNLHDYVEGLLGEFAEDQGTSITDVFRGVQTGTSKTGKILVNNRFLVVLSTFVAWLRVKLGLTDSTAQTLQSGGAYLGNCVVYRLPIRYAFNDGQEFTLTEFIGGPVYALYENKWYTPILVSTEGATAHTTRYRNGNLLDEQYITLTKERYQVPDGSGIIIDPNNVYIARTGSVYYPWTVTTSNISPIFYSWSQCETAIETGVLGNVAGIYADVGVIMPPEDDPSYTDGDGAVIDVNGLWGKSYDDILGDMEDDLTGGLPIEADITYQGEDEVADQVEDTLTSAISQEVSDYQSPGLQSVFPFCIPFDIYAFFECLAADPVAPAFAWRFYVPGICDEEFTVDLAPFSPVAQVVRTMELLAFIVGLALVTRDKFLRG